MRTTFKVGLIGCGKVAENRHLPALSRIGDLEIVAVADPEGDALRRAEQRYGIRRCFEDYREMLAQTDVEAVGVLTNLERHHEAAMAVLESGRHLLLEKPLAMSLDQADQLVDRVRETGLTALMAFNSRWHPLARRARALIRQGALGPVGLISTTLSTCHHRRYIPPWRSVRAQGGGSLIENGSHSYDLWRFLTGSEIVEVSAVSRRTGQVDDEPSVVTARGKDGVIFNGLFSDLLPDRNQIEIFAQESHVSVSLYRFDGLRITPVYSCDGHMKNRLRRAARFAREFPRGLLQLRRGGDFCGAFEAEWRHFIDCVRHGHTPECTLEDGREALRVALAALQSTITGQTVRIEDAARQITPL